MPRLMINGVIWNKTQDTILRVGIRKYGKNKSERILPLLPEKSVEQCKNRVKVGLHRSINKCEWTTKDDQKLLRFAMLMPGNWHKISSIVRREPVDCFNRYHYLLNKIQDNSQVKDGRTADVRAKLISRMVFHIPGMDSTDESNHMDENGLDIVMSKAHIRLKKNQAKYAKLWAREKQLEVARRFECVRKQRERIRKKARAVNFCDL